MSKVIMNLCEFEDQIFIERNGRKPVYINKHLANKFADFCENQKKDPHKVAEYLISLGINTIEHYEDPKVLLDIQAL